MDMANFSNEQQVELANSKFVQTSTLANLNMEQQAIMQNATAMAASAAKPPSFNTSTPTEVHTLLSLTTIAVLDVLL